MNTWHETVNSNVSFEIEFASAHTRYARSALSTVVYYCPPVPLLAPYLHTDTYLRKFEASILMKC